MVHKPPRGDIPPESTDDLEAQVDAMLVGKAGPSAVEDAMPEMTAEKWELREAQEQISALRVYIRHVKEEMRGVLTFVLAFSAMALLFIAIDRPSQLAAAAMVVGSWAGSWWVAGRIANSIIRPD